MPNATTNDTDDQLSELEPGDTFVWDGHTERVVDTEGDAIVTEVVYESADALLDAAKACEVTYVPADSE